MFDTYEKNDILIMPGNDTILHHDNLVERICYLSKRPDLLCVFLTGI